MANGKKSMRTIFPVAALLLVLTICLLPFAFCHVAQGAADWPGVDETVVEKISGEHGREAREPLINTDQGDLLLFVFLLAGAVGGFAAGYYWRMLTEKNSAGRREGPTTPCRDDNHASS